MGANCCREPPLPEYAIAANKVLAQLEPVIFATKLKKPFIGTIRKIFDSIDEKKKGRIRIEQIEDFLETPKLPYVRKVLGLFNHDNSGVLDFPEFLMMTWMYCTMDLFTLRKLYFFTYSSTIGNDPNYQ
jgi:hypothetical protein